MKVIGPHAEEGEGEGTDIVAFANTSVDVFKEVLDSLRKRSVWQCSQHKNKNGDLCVSVHSIKTKTEICVSVCRSIKKNKQKRRSVWQCSQHCRSGSEQGNG